MTEYAIVEAAPPSEESRLAWMALTLTPGMGPTRIRKAMDRLRATSTIANLLHASLTELEACGLPAASAQFVFDGRAQAAAEAEIKRLGEAGGRFLTQDCAEYPERLLEIYDPPSV